MVGKVICSLAFPVLVSSPVAAAKFTCQLVQGGQPVIAEGMECKLDSADESQSYCEHTFSTGASVVGFCYAYPLDAGHGQAQTSEKILLGCGFVNSEGKAQARSATRQRAQSAVNRSSQAVTLPSDFEALGDTVGVNHNVVVQYAPGQLFYIGLCNNPAQ